MKRVRGSFRIPLLSRGLHRLSIRILFVNHLLQIMNGGGGHTDYYFIFTATTSSIWISHVELFISICTIITRPEDGVFMTELTYLLKHDTCRTAFVCPRSIQI